ncbi:hypothetical protein FKM82_000606 [Ascaphus truei]
MRMKYSNRQQIITSKYNFTEVLKRININRQNICKHHMHIDSVNHMDQCISKIQGYIISVWWIISNCLALIALLTSISTLYKKANTYPLKRQRLLLQCLQALSRARRFIIKTTLKKNSIGALSYRKITHRRYK